MIFLKSWSEISRVSKTQKCSSLEGLVKKCIVIETRQSIQWTLDILFSEKYEYCTKKAIK